MAPVLRLSALLLLPVLPAAADSGIASMPVAGGVLGFGLVAVVGCAWLGWRLQQVTARLRNATARNAHLAAIEVQLRETAERAEAKARMLDGVMAAMSDGVAVVDGDFRLVSWNSRFPEIAGVPRKALRIGMPFAEVVRRQAEGGEFGLLDPEAETERRMSLLREGKILERWQRERPDGSLIELRRAPLPGGGFVTLYSPVTRAATREEPGLAAAFRQEWRTRVPGLTGAATEGNLPAVRAAAHALRGIAGNAGWGGAAAALGALEAAAEEGDLGEVRTLAAMLVMDDPW